MRSLFLLLCGVSLAACSVEKRLQRATSIPEDRGSGAWQAMQYRAMRMRDENGVIAPFARRAAIAERRAMLDWQELTDGGGIGNLGWTERGPDNIGGRTRSLLVHPTNPLILFAGSVSGGVWKSTTGGLSWQPLDDFMGNLAIGCMAWDPNDTDVIYAGTGEGFGNGDAVRGEGIWRTLDGGDSWQLLANTANFGNVNRMAVSPADSDIILAATANGIRRTTNGGASWNTVWGSRSFQVLFDPNDANRCVAHQVTAFGGGTPSVHSILWSVDAGATWTVAGGGYATGTRIELAYAPSVTNRLYASVNGGECWRSLDGGQSWTQRTTTPISGSQWWYCNTIWVDPFNSNYVVIGNVNVWRSSNGGQTFTRVGAGGVVNPFPHCDVHSFVQHPGYDGVGERRLYACTDGGVWQADDARTVSQAAGWTRLDAGFRTIQYYGVSGVPGRIVGGTQDNGSHVINYDTSNAAHFTFGNDGGVSQIDPTSRNRVYGEWQNLNVHRSTDGGQTAQPINTGLTEAGVGTSNFIAPMVLPIDDPTWLFAGGIRLWRCRPRTAVPVWSVAKGSNGSPISAIAVDPHDVDTVWVGHNNGTVFRTGNATGASPVWTPVDDNGAFDPLPNRTITRILIDRGDPSRVLVATGGFTDDNLWRTTNNGLQWSEVTGVAPSGLPSAPIYGLAQHPSLDGRYYVASEVGVFGTSDDCQTWSTSNDGPADVSCDDITFVHGTATLLVGTHGRGIWTTEIAEPQVVDLGAGCSGSNGVPALAATDPRIGSTCVIGASNLVADAPAWLLHGQSSTSWFGNLLPFDLTVFGAPGCFLRVRPDIVYDGAANSVGDYTASLPIPAHTAFLGVPWYVQLFAWDPSANDFGRTASNGLRLTIGN